MKAFGYLTASAALLTIAVAQVLKSPAPNSSLGNGWRYKGCYSDVNILVNSANHALGGSFQTALINGGASCTATCRSQGYRYAGTIDNQCWCDNVINRSNSPTAGILSPLGDASCQSSCSLNINEACGQTNSFISIYEYTVSEFLRLTCVPMLLLLYALFVWVGGHGERLGARWIGEIVRGSCQDCVGCWRGRRWGPV
ncbi:WSC domain-containing protein [Stagonosporopsis vannaccii]|nr:WSC domain-containing protein [Stagonosporopsis vannaccii]